MSKFHHPEHINTDAKEGERPAMRDPTTISPVPQARDVLVEGLIKR
jgi:hypothetical protein